MRNRSQADAQLRLTLLEDNGRLHERLIKASETMYRVLSDLSERVTDPKGARERIAFHRFRILTDFSSTFRGTVLAIERHAQDRRSGVGASSAESEALVGAWALMDMGTQLTLMWTDVGDDLVACLDRVQNAITAGPEAPKHLKEAKAFYDAVMRSCREETAAVVGRRRQRGPDISS
jgi:hypothetical protein